MRTERTDLGRQLAPPRTVGVRTRFSSSAIACRLIPSPRSLLILSATGAEANPLRDRAVSAEAALAAKQAELAVRSGAGAIERKPMRPEDLHPLFAAYVEDIRLRGRDPKTVSRAFYALRRLQGWLEEAGIDPRDVDEHRLKQYVAYLRNTVANWSAKLETEKVKACYRYAVRIGMLERNPAEYVEAPSLVDREPETYTNDELRRIRAAIRDDLEDVLFHGFAYTGMRRFELSGLRWDDVDFENATMRVLGKGGKLRKVPLHPRLAEVLVERERKVGGEFALGDGGSTRNINTRLMKLLDRAGVDGGNRPAHRFRATVQCSLYEEQTQCHGLSVNTGTLREHGDATSPGRLGEWCPSVDRSTAGRSCLRRGGFESSRPDGSIRRISDPRFNMRFDRPSGSI